ncbi:hypothetical protein R1sor_023018 [Riccia sorocarpa]|uniref:Endonuclease/exonuclease/phosphatase domain-containing protein n=1 Tax=Riccia sorocarpa TaxID=122646 RepID=A0ABD3GPI2_9MARC
MTTPMENTQQQAERLIQAMSIEGAPPCIYRIQRPLKDGMTAMAILLSMGLVAIFPGRVPSLDSYKAWTHDHWETRMRLSVLHSRYVGRNAFLTMFDQKQHRDIALARQPPTVQNSRSKMLPWSPQCEKEGLSLSTQAVWVEMPYISSLLAEWIPDLFQQLGLVIQMPTTSMLLSYEHARAQILWDTKNEIPPHVEIELADHVEGKSFILRQEVTFLEPGACRKCNRPYHGRTPCGTPPGNLSHKRKERSDQPDANSVELGSRTKRTSFWHPDRLANFQKSQEQPDQTHPPREFPEIGHIGTSSGAATNPTVAESSSQQPPTGKSTEASQKHLQTKSATAKHAPTKGLQWVPKPKHPTPPTTKSDDPSNTPSSGPPKDQNPSNTNEGVPEYTPIERDDLHTAGVHHGTGNPTLQAGLASNLFTDRHQQPLTEPEHGPRVSHILGDKLHLHASNNSDQALTLKIIRTATPNSSEGTPSEPEDAKAEESGQSQGPSEENRRHFIQMLVNPAAFNEDLPHEIGTPAGQQHFPINYEAPTAETPFISSKRKAEKPLILALHETKLTNNRFKLAAANIAPKYTMIAAQGKRGGGTAILLHPSITLKDSGRMADGNLTWARIEFQGHSIHIAAVYGPHSPGARAQFWKRLNQFLPYRQWILMGDWNSVERPDQTSGTRNVMSGDEETNFRSLKLKFSLSDAFDLAEQRKGPHYTRHIQYNSEFRWSTLDRIYLPSDAVWFEAVEGIDHQAEYTLSDHMPVTIDLALGGRLPRGLKFQTYFKFDAHLMAQLETQTRLKELWNQATSDEHDPIKAYHKGWGLIHDHMKAKQREQRAQISQIDELGKKLKALHEQLPQDPTKEQLAEILETELEKRRREHTRDRLVRLWSRARYMSQGDAPTKYFFNLHRKQITQHQFDKLKLPDGTETTCKTQITKEATRVFTALYTSENRTEESRRDIFFVNSRLKNKVTDAQRAMLEEIPSCRELQDTLYSFPKGKAPGIDGANAEALQAMWNFTKNTYLQILYQFWETGTLPHTWLEGVIKLIPKGDSKDKLTDWRPITLLNTCYKILAKLLASRYS